MHNNNNNIQKLPNCSRHFLLYKPTDMEIQKLMIASFILSSAKQQMELKNLCKRTKLNQLLLSAEFYCVFLV